MAMKFIDMTGKTEEEAIRKALAELGLERDDVSVEILERAKSGFFGIGASPAKVRVSYGLEEEAAPAPAAAAEKVEKRAEESVKTAPKAEKRKSEKKADGDRFFHRNHHFSFLPTGVHTETVSY